MFKKSDNLLKLDFEINRGLILKWNFSGNQNTCFYRHIVIFDCDQSFNSKLFGQFYFKNLKLGDMIQFVWITAQQQIYLQKWKQKTPFTQLQLSKIKPIITSIKNIMITLSELDKRTSQFMEPTIYNIVTLKGQKQIKQIQNYLKPWIDKQQKFLVNIFSFYDNSIEPNKGINYLNLQQFIKDKSDQIWNAFKLYINQISLFKIKITIQCQNGSFASKKQDQWTNQDFNKISRIIHAPSINYTQDIIQFLNQDSPQQVNYSLNITLQFTQLENKKYTASKKITIKSINEKVYQRTFSGRQIQFPTQVHQEFYSRKNPFKSQSLVWFKKDILV